MVISAPNCRRFVLMQYHQGQSTLPRLAAFLRSVGVVISKRQLQRLLTDQQEIFVAEAQDVLRAGLETSPYVSVDDTGARHKAKNGFFTQIGNDWFTWFGTRISKSRLNFLELLRAGHTDYVLNDAAYDYMRKHSLSVPLIASLAARPQTCFADQATWLAHLDRLGITKLDVTPDPVRVATEGALWGSVQSHKCLCDAVVLSDDAGQFDVGHHALCWVHAERLVHKLDTFTCMHRAAQTCVRGLIWNYYASLQGLPAQAKPAPGCRLVRAVLPHLPAPPRLRYAGPAAKAAACQQGGVADGAGPAADAVATNGLENDIRCYVTRRKVSAGTRSDAGRDSRDALLGLAKTCDKLGIAVWDYLGSRLNVAAHILVEPLDRYVRGRFRPA